MYNGPIDWNENDDRFLAVKIYKKAVHNKFKSEQENRQVFDDKLYISIMSPGQKNSVADRPMSEKDKVRFAKHLENFEKNNGQLVQGVAIEMLPAITPAQIATLKAMKVLTIEQLAGLHEKTILDLYDGRELVKRADKFLKGESYTQELEKTIKLLEDRIKLLEGGKDEPINDNPKRNKRNTTKRRAADGN